MKRACHAAVVLALGAALSMSPAGAQEPQRQGSHAYIGVAAGAADNRLQHDSTTGRKAFVGWSLEDAIGVELGYGDFGTVSRAGQTTGISTVYLAGVAYLAFSPAFGILGKLGVHYANVDVIPGPAPDEGFDAIYGLGARYRLTDAVGLRAEWERYRIAYNETDLFSAGVYVRF